MNKSLDLARVLLVADELASRLTLQTLLQAGGYRVDVAASAAEAFHQSWTKAKYQLVLSESEIESHRGRLASAVLRPRQGI